MTSEFDAVTPKVGKSIRDNLGDFDFKNTLIVVNGKVQSPEYIIQDDDLISIRQYPNSTAALIVGGIVAAYAIADGINVACGNESWTKKALRKLVQWCLPETDSTSSDREQLKNYPTISGAKNTSSLGKTIPLVLGKSKFTPYYIGQPYTTIGGTDGKDVYYHCLYLLGYNDIQVRNISLGIYELSANDGQTDGVLPSEDYDTDNPVQTALDSGELGLNFGSNAHFDPKEYGIQLELQQGANEVSLYDQKVVQSQLGTELLYPHGASRLEVYSFSAKYPHKVSVEIQLNGLIGYTSEGKKKNATVKVGVQMSVDGGTTWQPFASFAGCTKR